MARSPMVDGTARGVIEQRLYDKRDRIAKIEKTSYSSLVPLNLLASCSPSDLGDMERGESTADEWGRRLRSAAVGQGRLGGRSPLS